MSESKDCSFATNPAAVNPLATSAEKISHYPNRIAVCVEYNGSAFHGWQKQLSPQLATVQLCLEKALGKVANHPVKLICAGRTDAGVHATGQVVHFDCEIDRGEKAWVRGVTSLLPQGVCLRWARKVEREFHARFSALSRRYRYVIYNHPIRPGIMWQQLTWHVPSLCVEAMDEAGKYLLGEHDFSCFRAAACQSNSPRRDVVELSVKRCGAFIVVDIEANAFLQHMVRNIVGTLLVIGEGREKPEWVRQILQLKDRTKAAVTAPGSGLYLVAVRYPENFALPEMPLGPYFLSN